LAAYTPSLPRGRAASDRGGFGRAALAAFSTAKPASLEVYRALRAAEAG